MDIVVTDKRAREIFSGSNQRNNVNERIRRIKKEWRD
jgi:hypothetical protein